MAYEINVEFLSVIFWKFKYSENCDFKTNVIFGLKLKEWDIFDEFETLCVSFLDDESL